MSTAVLLTLFSKERFRAGRGCEGERKCVLGRVERKRVKPNRGWVKAFICKLRALALGNTITD